MAPVLSHCMTLPDSLLALIRHPCKRACHSVVIGPAVPLVLYKVSKANAFFCGGRAEGGGRVGEGGREGGRE